uniref:Gamma-aminobutyric acid type B receptor subunit 1 n=1 Tax=Magallana gigas TaxID=29159 RepID=K1R7S6_MAGGI
MRSVVPVFGCGLALFLFLGRVKSKVPLHIGGILGSTDDSWSKYANFYNILFQVAFEEIGRTDILPNHELVFESKNSQADPGLAAKCLFELINEKPVKIAIFGPPKSNPYEIVGQITPKFYLTQQMNEFHKLLDENNITLVTSGIITDVQEVDVVIKRLKQYGARIIIGAFRSTKAPDIFCEIYKQKMFGKKYVWILTDSLYKGWIGKLEEGQESCAVDNIKASAYGHFTLGQKQLRTDNMVTISGRTADEYEAWMKNISAQYNSSTMLLSKYSPWAYDAAWALAVGLNRSIKHLGGGELENFSYNRSDIYDAIQKGMEEVFFQGVSGPVSFKDGRRIGPAFIKINHEKYDDTKSEYWVEGTGAFKLEIIRQDIF